VTQIREEIISIVRNVNTRVTLTDDRDYERPLREIGIDSLDTMSVFLDVQEKFGLDEIPDAEIEKLTTLNLIVSYVEGELAKKGPT